MPEGDTIWRAAHRLHAAFADHVIIDSDFRIPSLATASITGSTVLHVQARGKHLLMRLDDERTLHTHLGMDGSWRIEHPPTRWAHHSVRLMIANAQWRGVGRLLPTIDLLPTVQEATVVGHLGPDLLGEDWDVDIAIANLLRDGGIPVSEALLDQRNLAGVGNVYASELPFLIGVHPATPIAQVPDLPELLRLAQRHLQRNCHTPRRTTTGWEQPDQALYVYGRKGRPCRRCGTNIAGGTQQDRVRYWCPSCQPGP
jgi:endonuclease-8